MAVVDKQIPILQIVGYQNSGKTTLTTKIIELLSSEGLRIGALKHHGHGGTPLDLSLSKDSTKHKQAGALVAAVEGEGTIQITASTPSFSIKSILKLYEALEVDMIVVEGYKKLTYPKIIMVKSKEDFQSLMQLNNVVACISWIDLASVKMKNVPIFMIQDEQLFMNWINNYIRSLL
ncbi:molybdopterin-guanine dinucleotide biosynthesis protein B [Bacillus sp. HMF5848]|uniref:molybdopterin-guanine dinucleotide biosynthesis protein B n=1 Tax=Bacillus sp. HMF5848 TaxID=2495421 RepID=UPI000F77CE48|nr:molybdopterin-guanine dinucleotide biosynthesis protein B [Bacillus sp. HMF5848]RSK27944.1 molybdopterin-guanine dinucleotide biosynthesis protein B [Bacillus sp. HMF5848]